MSSIRSGNPLTANGHYSNISPCPHPPLSFGDVKLPESPSFKVVGLTFTNNLRWNTHIQNVAKNAGRALAHLNRARAVFDKPSLLQLYKSHVRSTMEYCSPIWMGASNTSIALLDRIQSRAAKLIGPKAIELPCLSHRRDVTALCAMHRIVHDTAPQPLLSFRPTLTTRRRSARLGPPTMFVEPRVDSVKAKYWIRSFIPLLTSAWNKLDPHLQNTKDLKEFKNKIKNKSLEISFYQLKQ
jgi:hypothetical protein